MVARRVHAPHVTLIRLYSLDIGLCKAHAAVPPAMLFQEDACTLPLVCASWTPS